MTAASFQKTVNQYMGFGVPGELFVDSPSRVAPFTLNSAQASYNIIGATAYTVSSDGVAQAGNPGGTNVYAGILIGPKEQALIGDGSNPLNPSMTLPNNVIAELITMGIIIVSLPAAANIGDVVIFDNTTGALSTIAPGVALPAGKSYANAYVRRYTVSAAGLAVIEINPVTPAVVQ
jgi:hypothetical protein